jgi:hypothetical protein
MKLGQEIGKGFERAVYLHPEEMGRVIKIMLPSAKHNRNALDLCYFRTAPSSVTAHVPKMFGEIETEFGKGIVCELIADSSGQPSRSVRKSVEAGVIGSAEAEAMLKEFLCWADHILLPLFDGGIDNILLQDRSEGRRLVMVDGFGMGNRSLKWRLRMCSPFLIRRSNAKRARKMWREWQEYISYEW